MEPAFPVLVAGSGIGEPPLRVKWVSGTNGVTSLRRVPDPAPGPLSNYVRSAGLSSASVIAFISHQLRSARSVASFSNLCQ